MLVKGTYEKARLYIEAHSTTPAAFQRNFYPCVTISREAGSGSGIVSEELIKFFSRKKYKIEGTPEWTVFDKNLITEILLEHHLPEFLQNSFAEDKHSFMTSVLTELFTGQPAGWTLMAKEIQTILHLASVGNVIIIGRGANFITSRLKNSFNVRLVAPLEQRIKRVQDLYNIPRKEVEIRLKKDDEARKKFVLSHFNQNVEDPLCYHLVVNTGVMSYSDAAGIIGRAVVRKFPSLYSRKKGEEQKPVI